MTRAANVISAMMSTHVLRRHTYNQQIYILLTQVDGVSKQLDQYLQRNSALGNAVVPVQAKYAFSILSGLLPYKGPSVKTVEAKQKSTRLQRGKKRTAPTLQSVVSVKKPFLTSSDAPGTRRSGRIRAMVEMSVNQLITQEESCSTT